MKDDVERIRCVADFNLEVLGVYRLEATDDLVAAQARILSGGGSTEGSHKIRFAKARRQLESTVLLEVLVRNASVSFDVGDFSQPSPELPRDNWQAAWAETFLTADGVHVLGRWSKPLALPLEFRVTFFVHSWQVTTPLRFKDVDVPCPAPAEMPDRLRKLVRYECVD